MLKNIGSNWVLLLVAILSTFFLLPFNLHHLGEEQYGLWLLIASFTGYLSLLQLGVPMASVRHLAQAIAVGDQAALHRLVASCAGLYLGLGSIAAMVGMVLFFFYENTVTIPPDYVAPARYAFLLAVFNVALGFIAQLPYAIMNAYQDFVRTNLLAATMILLRVAVNVALVLYFPSLLALAAIQVVVTLVEMIVLWTIIFRVHKDVRLRPSQFSFAEVRGIFSFSVLVLLLNLGAQLSFQTDAIVIGTCLSAADVPTFAVGNNLILYLMQFVVGIASVIMPLATSLQAQNKLDELRTVFLKWSKLAIALTWCAGLYLVIFGPDFLAAWIGGKFEAPSGRVLRILMLSYFFFLPVRGVALPVLMGLGKAARPVCVFLAAGVANLLLSLALVGPLGLDGVAWGTTIPNIVLAAALLYLVCKELEIPIVSYLANTLPYAVLGLGVLFLVLLGLRELWRPASFWELGVAGVTTVVFFASMWLLLVFRNDAHVQFPWLDRILTRRVP